MASIGLPPHGTQVAGASNLVQAHLAEYAALTTRNTYWITLQFALWPTAIIFLALVGQMWPSSSAMGVQHFLLWAGMTGLQVIGLVWYLAAREQYGNVAYLETVLRPKVVDAVGSSHDVWLYESQLAESRGRGPWVSEWSIAFFSIAGLVGVTVACIQFGWIAWDSAGAATCLALCWVHMQQSLNLKRIRGRMTPSVASGAGAARQPAGLPRP